MSLVKEPLYIDVYENIIRIYMGKIIKTKKLRQRAPHKLS